MFGLWSYGIICWIEGNDISAKLIHPDDADYPYDPDFRVFLKTSKVEPVLEVS